MKLYTSTGNNVDGTITQNAITNAIANGSVNKAKYDTSDNQINGYVRSIVKDQSDPNKLLITRGDGSTFTADISNVFSTTYSGLVPAPTSAGDDIYLRSDGTWGKLPNLSTQSAGIVPAANADTFSFLRGDGTWASFNSLDYNNLIKDVSLAGDDIEDDIKVTRYDGSTYSINISDYGSEDDDEILDLTGGETQYIYNGSTYNYRLGEYSRQSESVLEPVEVVNNKVFRKTNESDPDVEYNSTDIYAERIKIPGPVVEEPEPEPDPEPEEPTDPTDPETNPTDNTDNTDPTEGE
jgi:hypothetical protein